MAELLRVAPDHRHLEDIYGNRVFLIGDTAWELFHRLSREEAVEYLEKRREQGFTMVQAVVLAEFDGLTVPNVYGRTPLKKNADGNYDPDLPDIEGDYSYFDHVEFILTEAEKRGIHVGLLPTWGDKYNRKWGVGPEIFTPENARRWGIFLARKVAHHKNILWILGGDRPLEEKHHYEIIHAMARGLREALGSRFLITFHPTGASSSVQWLKDASWLDFHMCQSGHGFPTKPCYELLLETLAQEPEKPVMDGEPCYEDHPINFKEENGYFDEVDVRLAAFRDYFSGSCSHTYGHSSVWGFQTDVTPYWPNDWKTSLDRPGAAWIRYFRHFTEEHPFTSLVPAPDTIKNNLHNANYIASMKGNNELWLYVPCGAPVELDREALDFVPQSVELYSPLTGEFVKKFSYPSDNRLYYAGEGCGRGCDRIFRVISAL